MKSIKKKLTLFPLLLTILLILLLISVASCSKPIFDNAYDPKADPDKWAPTNLNYFLLEDYSVELSWIDNSYFEEGFKIDRKLPNSNWMIEYGLTETNNYQWIDNTVENYIIKYRIYAFLGEYISTKVEIICPLFFNKTFNDGQGKCVQQTSDGGYIIAGSKKISGLDSDCHIIKTDIIGDIEWTETFVSSGGGSHYAYSVQQTTDGGYIIVDSGNYSSASSDCHIIKTDTNGNEEWDQTFGGSGFDEAHSVQQTTDGGYIVSGITTSYGAGNVDFWLIKTDINGNEEWNQTFGGSSVDEAHSVQQTTDGGFIVAGYTGSFGAGNSDVWLVKTDAIGNEEWDQTFGGSSEDAAFSVQQTTDGGFILAGYTKSFGAGNSDFWLIKTDTNGNEEWNKTFGGSNYDEAYSVQQTTDGGFVIVGTTSDFWFIKTDSNGNEEWNRNFGGDFEHSASSVQQTTDGGFVIVGTTSDNKIVIIKIPPFGDSNKISKEAYYKKNTKHTKNTEIN